jgi:tetratricopeptide (TPR) repeat protein
VGAALQLRSGQPLSLVHLFAQGSSTPASSDPIQQARRALNEGRYDEVEGLVRGAKNADTAAALRAQADIARGRYEEAEASLRQAAAAAPTGDAALELGLLYLMLGRKADGTRTLETIADRAQNASRPADFFRGARAARAVGDVRFAQDLYRAASAGDPKNAEIHASWGELFLEKYNRGEAVKSFQDALKIDPQWAAAHLGVARAVADEDPPTAMGAVQGALKINPKLVDAHLFLAEVAFDERDYGKARDAIARAVDINPKSLEAMALRAAMAQLEDRPEDFKAEAARALAINPVYGDLYTRAGLVLARNYRFDEAVALTKQALALEPDSVRAHAALGQHLMRTGDEPGARQALERAFKQDPFDVVTFNLLNLLDTLDKFVTEKQGDVELRLDPGDAPVLKEYAMPLVQQSIETFSKLYDFKIKGPLLVEIFPKHDDFAVRILGLPGMEGALGVCFGRVVASDSPRARPGRPFNWSAVLWHEMAHVVTLQMSNQRIPRWLTEGISEFEEKRAHPEWAREMDLTFAQAMNANQILKLKDLNAAFTNPETISLAYFEASLFVDHLFNRFGQSGLNRLVRAFAEGKETEPTLKQVLNVTLDDLQVTFDAALEKQFGAVRSALRIPEGVKLGAASLDELQILAKANPESYPVLLTLGRGLVKAGDRKAATEVLERAAKLVPIARGADSPRALLARLALDAGDKTRAIAELEAHIAVDYTDVESARRLASLVDPSTDPRRARLAHERIVAIDPFDSRSHSILGRLLLAAKDPRAVQEFRAALAAGPVDQAAAHTDLGESYLSGGRRAEARREALRALEIAPTFGRAQDLLLKTSEGRQ